MPPPGDIATGRNGSSRLIDGSGFLVAHLQRCGHCGRLSPDPLVVTDLNHDRIPDVVVGDDGVGSLEINSPFGLSFGKETARSRHPLRFKRKSAPCRLVLRI